MAPQQPIVNMALPRARQQAVRSRERQPGDYCVEGHGRTGDGALGEELEGARMGLADVGAAGAAFDDGACVWEFKGHV
jgi:hypothetical protein